MEVRGYGPIVLPAGVTPKAKHGPRKGVTARYRQSTIPRNSAGLGGQYRVRAGHKGIDARIEAIAAKVREGKMSYEDALQRVKKFA